VSFRPEALIKRPPHEGAEYAVAFKAKTVLRVRPLPCLPPYAGYLHNVHPGFWFNRRGWNEWRADLGKVSLKQKREYAGSDGNGAQARAGFVPRLSMRGT
jgi:hypothetical protein